MYDGVGYTSVCKVLSAKLLSLLQVLKVNANFWFRCVRLARFENDRTISFIPPDGSFDLMTYRLSTQVHLLLYKCCFFSFLFLVAYSMTFVRLIIIIILLSGKAFDLGGSSSRKAFKKSY